MKISDLILWLSAAPHLSGETMNWNYLPSYAGWSLTIPKTETGADILGNCRSTMQLKITRRYTVQSNEDRIKVVDLLEDLAEWARENPPENTRLRVSGLPQFTSRNNSGIEDIAITLTIEESDTHR